MKNVKKFEDDNVIKFVFEFENAIAEAVLYRYPTYDKRTVMCVSVQSGCPVGCTFCGTGKKFIRNLTDDEILRQVIYLSDYVEEVSGVKLRDEECEKFQIMFMSMGEPMLNYTNVSNVIEDLEFLYPESQLLLSTVGIKDKKVLDSILHDGYYRDNVGLQFSIHEADERRRDFLIPFKNKLNLREIRDYGLLWSKKCEKQVYLNYCVCESNTNASDLNRLMDLFPPDNFAFTFSAICESEEGKISCDTSLILNNCQNVFLNAGYNVRIFDPAGKDTLGGGCGQLWYTQQYFKDHNVK